MTDHATDSLTTGGLADTFADTYSVTCIIPAYNEEQAIGDVVRRLKSACPAFEVLVVDDGSRDKTAEAAEQAGAVVIRHTYNLGNGASVKSGIRHATGNVVVMLDADGQHPPEAIQQLLAHIGPYDMVVGARSRNADVSKFRGFGNRVLIAIAGYLTDSKIPDLTSGFRAVKRDKALEFVHLFPNRYSYPTTLTMCMLKTGHFVHYVPLDGIQRRRSGKSNIQPFRDGMRFINIMIRIIMLFDPQKIFLPIGLFLLSVGIFIAFLQIATKMTVTGSAVLMFLSGLFMILIGLVADQIAAIRREMNRFRAS